MSNNKIEPTDAMVDVVESARELVALDARTIMRAALNHPDARGLFTDEDGRPWDPLSKGDPLNVGDEVRQDYFGVTTTAVVGRVSRFGDPMTARGAFIGSLRWGTWYVRRAAQELPTEKGAVIVPADGHECIEATRYGRTWRTVQAARDFSGGWVGAWRNGADVVAQIAPDSITPGTWRLA